MCRWRVFQGERVGSRTPRKTAVYREDRFDTLDTSSPFLYSRQDKKRIAGIVSSVNERARFSLSVEDREKEKALRLFFRKLDNGLLELLIEGDAVGFGLADKFQRAPIVFGHVEKVDQVVVGPGVAGVGRDGF